MENIDEKQESINNARKIYETLCQNISENEETRRGELMAQILKLKHSKEFPDRFNTQWGTKTAIGLYRIINRIVLDGE